MNYKLCVITRADPFDDGNLADTCFGYHPIHGTNVLGYYDSDNEEDCDEIKHQCFTQGEIFIVSDDSFLGEIGASGRSPRKVDVSYELFDMDQIEKAIELAREVM